MVNVANLLTLRYDPDAGHHKTIRNISSQEILNYRQASNPVPSSKEIEALLRTKIRDKIEELGPHTLSTAISAGIDSNVVLCLVKKEFPNMDLNCLTVSFDNEDDSKSEIRAAKGIAESYNAEFHEIYIYNPLKDLPLLISIIKEPRWNIYQYYFIEKVGFQKFYSLATEEMSYLGDIHSDIRNLLKTCPQSIRGLTEYASIYYAMSETGLQIKSQCLGTRQNSHGHLYIKF